MKTNTKAIIIPDFMIILRTINKFGVLSVSDIHYETKITYSHLHKLKKYFVERNWINIEKEGVRHLISLTSIGKDIVEHINSLLDIMKITDENLVEYRKKSKRIIRGEEMKDDKNPNKYKNAYAGIKITKRDDDEEPQVDKSVDPHVTPEEDIPESKVEEIDTNVFKVEEEESDEEETKPENLLIQPDNEEDENGRENNRAQ